MRVGDGNVEAGRHLTLLDVHVCWSPLGGGEGGSKDSVPYGGGGRRTVEAWEEGRMGVSVGGGGDGVCGGGLLSVLRREMNGKGEF